MSNLPPLSKYIQVIKEKKDLPLPIYSVTLSNGMQPRDTLGRSVLSELEGKDNLFAAKGDICYNMMRMWQGASGLVPEDCHVSPAYVVCRPKENLDPIYASYMLKSQEAIKAFIDRSQGVTSDRWRLYPDEFLKISLFIPPLPEQKKIAEILSGIDTEIDALSTLISLLTLGKRNLLQDAAEKEPDKFSVKALGEIASVINGYAFSSSDLEDSGNGIPVIRMSNLKSGAVQYESALKIQESKASGLERFLLKKGDLLIGMSGSISNTALVTSEKAALLNQRVGALRANNEGSFYHAIAYQSGIAMRQVEQMAAGGAQLNISSSQIESIEIPVPSRQEMDKITQCWFSMESTIRLYEIKLSRLRSLKNALASDLLSGRKRVSI